MMGELKKVIEGQRPNFRTSTRGRLALAFMGMAALPVLLIGAFSYDYAQNSLNERLDNTFNSVLDLKQNEITRWVELIQSDTQLLADNYLNEERITAILNPAMNPLTKEAVRQLLRENLLSLQNARPGYVEIYYVDRSGVVLVSTDEDSVGENVGDRDVVRRVFASPDGANADDIRIEDGGAQIAFGRVMHEVNPATMRTTDVVNAALVISVGLDDSLYPIVADWPARGRTGELYLIDENGGSLFYASPLRFSGQGPLAATAEPELAAMVGQKVLIPLESHEIVEAQNYDGEIVLRGYRPIAGTGWKLVLEQNMTEALGPVIALRSIWGFVTAVVLLVAFLVASWLARSLTSPLNELIVAARKVEQGELDTRVSLERDDEFGELGNAFNRMIEAVHGHAEKIEQHSEELQSLVNLSDTFLASVDVRETLETAIREMMRATHSDLGGAFLMLENGTEFKTVAQVNLPDELLNVQYPVDAHSSPGYALLQRKTISSEDLSKETRFGVPPALGKQGIVANMSTPMLINGRSVGAVTVGSKRLREFSQEEISMAQTIANHTAVALERIKLVSDLSESYDRTLSALAVALDTRDRETEGHSKRVVAYTLALAEKMGMPMNEMQEIGRGALLHDIGKIGVPDSILHKSDQLNEGDWAIVRKHPEWGKQILEGIRFLDGPAKMVLAHHERWDGSGYPLGLKGEEIPLGARIFSVVDAFDAITSYRPYRNPGSYEKARAEIRKASGEQFDPKVVDAFLTFSKEDWMQLREQAMGAAAENGNLQDMGSLRRIGSGHLQAMNVIISAITSSLDITEVLERTAQKLVEVTRAVGVGIYLFEGAEEKLSFATGVGVPEELKIVGEKPLDVDLPRQSLLKQGVSHFSKNIASAPEEEFRSLHKLGPKWGSYLCVPLAESGKIAGALVVFSEAPHSFQEDERVLFEHAGKQLGQAVVNARLHERVRHQSITDKLTGAYNRHYLDDFLNIEVKRSLRYQRPIAVLMLDLDHFRSCNERGGHQAGDKALRDVVQLMNMGVRSVDLVARYGGEEFLMVLPETDAVGAMEVAERIRKLIDKHHFPCGELTASIGVTATAYQAEDKPNAEELIGRADKALYKAKADGRNRTMLWNKDMVTGTKKE
jgi:diguanylate cyclase (GGDEF)-like protein